MEWELNMADRLAIRKVILDRCTSLIADYALYILGNVSATAAQTAWAQTAIDSAASWGDRLSYHVLNQPAFIAGGSSIPDATLQGVIQAALNAHYIPRYEPGE
jgi:hypothetical protein